MSSIICLFLSTITVALAVNDHETSYPIGYETVHLKQEVLQLKQSNMDLQTTIMTLAEKYETMAERYETMARKQDKKLNEMKQKYNTKFDKITKKLDQCESNIMSNKNSKTINASVIRMEKFPHRRLLTPTIRSTTLPVAFSAELSKLLPNLGTNHAIAYDRILLNAGGHYNKNDGIFTAPQDGVYVFSWSVMAESNAYQGTELVIDGSYVSYAYSGATAGYESASKTIIVQLKTGNEVWIRTNSETNSGHTLHGGGYNSFSGFLLQDK